MAASEPSTEVVDLSAAARLVVEGERAAPAAVVGAAQRDARGAWRLGYGCAGRLYLEPPQGAPRTAPLARRDTLFDLASVSKPLVALLLARLVRAGVVTRELELGACLPGVALGPAAHVTLEALSAHRSGLEGHRELYHAELGAAQRAPEAILSLAAHAMRPECRGAPPPEGFAPVYSDLGYMLLGAALEARAGTALDALLEREIAHPLGLRLGSAQRLAPAGLSPSEVAATELVPWRGGVVCGVVHDENAFVLAGRGLAGHAGAFGDVAAVVGVGMAIVEGLAGERASWLGAGELEPLVRRRPGGTLCAGFDRRSGDEPLSGRSFGPETFGHLGYTGTSLWIDPEQALVGVLLANRVHPTRYARVTGADGAHTTTDRPPAVARARRAAYDALAARMLAAPP